MTTARTVFIYCLSDPETGEIRYIGVTTRKLWQRLGQHLREEAGTHKSRWIGALKSRGLKPIIELIEESNDQWEATEKFWIKYFRFLGARLTNACAGGLGCLELSQEARAKISAKRKGIVFSEEHRKKIGDAQRGRKLPPEHLANCAAANKSRKLTPEQKARISEAIKKALVFSPERRARMSAAMIKVRANQRAQKLINQTTFQFP